jgi:hypothetical protein
VCATGWADMGIQWFIMGMRMDIPMTQISTGFDLLREVLSVLLPSPPFIFLFVLLLLFAFETHRMATPSSGRRESSSFLAYDRSVFQYLYKPWDVELQRSCCLTTLGARPVSPVGHMPLFSFCSLLHLLHRRKVMQTLRPAMRTNAGVLRALSILFFIGDRRSLPLTVSTTAM